MNDATLLVLAAGMGTRFGGLKQLEPVGPHGEAILDYSVFDALQAGFRRVVFIIRHDFEEAFRSQMLPRYAGHIDVAVAFQELSMLPAGFAAPPERQKPWGTAHAVLCAESAVGDAPFAVVNADDFYGAGAYRALMEFFQTPSPPGPDLTAVVGYRLRNTLSPHGTVARGVCAVDGDGFLQVAEELTAIESLPDGRARNIAPGAERELTGEEIVSMNIWGFRPSIFPLFRREFERFLRDHAGHPKAEFYIPTAMTALIAAGSARCRVLPTDDAWFGVTYRDDLPRVIDSLRALIRVGRYPERLWG